MPSIGDFSYTVQVWFNGNVIVNQHLNTEVALLRRSFQQLYFN
jgi:hypothetical protein